MRLAHYAVCAVIFVLALPFAFVDHRLAITPQAGCEHE